MISPYLAARQAEGSMMPLVGFANTRLAIVDISSAGHQPMHDPATGNWVSYNGEVYNHQELREELRQIDPRLIRACGRAGIRSDNSARSPQEWKSRTDTEVVLNAYATWGIECLERLRGMFAFAIWDDRRQHLLLARDRLGIKPLYYYVGDGFFLFASEVRTLLASGLISRRLDPTGLWQYLAYQSVPAPGTLVEGVRMLLPGSWLTVDAAGSITEGRYWDLLDSAAPDALAASPRESQRRLRELLHEAVALHLVSDVPLAAFLSGGIDSSAVVALMREVGDTVPRTFSVVFEESDYDEGRYAQRVASLFHTEHTEIGLSERDLLDQLPGALTAMDQPTGDGVNTYVISRAVRAAGIKVALSGLGGDEFFAGYPSFARLGRAAAFLRVWGRAPDNLRAVAGKALRTLGGSSVRVAKLAALMESDGTLASLFPLMRQVLSSAQRRAILTKPWVASADACADPYVHLLQEAFENSDASGLVSRISYAEARTYMHDVLLRDTDQMSMAHGLEVRVPLLDHKLVQWQMGLPDLRKRHNGTPKRLLVESLDGLLPDEIVYRRKQGFTLPFDPWMRGALKGFCEQRLGPGGLADRGIFRPEGLATLWESFLTGQRSTSWSHLWLLVVLAEWLEQNGVEA